MTLRLPLVSLAAAMQLVVTSPPTVAWAQAADKTSPAVPRVLEAKDVFEIEWASNPEIAPGGQRIVYQRNAMDVMTDRRRSRLWLVSADGVDSRPVGNGGDRDEFMPRWSPDGTRLLYAAREGDTVQLFVRFMDTGQSARLTQVLRAPNAASWSPDGRSIAFTMLVPQKTDPFAPMPDKPEGAIWADPPKVIQRLVYRADGEGYIENGFVHLFVVPADGGTPHQLTTGEFHVGGQPVFTPDGRAILIAGNRHPNWEREPNDSEIYEVGVADGAIRALTDRRGPDFAPSISPDGRAIAYLGYDDHYQGYQVTHLYQMNRDGSGARLLVGAFDRDAASPTWSSDGRGLFFTTADRGNGKIAWVATDGPTAGNVEILASDLGGGDLGRPYGGGTFSVSSAGRIAYTLSRVQVPADVAVAARGTATRVVTRLNDDLFTGKTLASAENVEFESSFDHRRIQGWVLKPPGFVAGKRYPMILEIHGGPFSDYGDRFGAEIQLYAAAGYVVLYVNPRGSTSYGEEFGNLIHHDYPSHDYEDLMSGVDAVLAKGYVDPAQLFVTGGSGGGVLTAWIVGKTDRFRAAVSVKPVINWMSFVLTADETSFFSRYWFAAPPWERPEEYIRRSPLSYVGKVKTPTMLLVGEQDFRTPISEAEQFYTALKLRDVDTALVRFPGASHELVTRPSQLIAKVNYILSWFAKYRLAGAGGQESR
ncbi:MAG: S9 family peptidase [Acidobacteria bacterium]|nr:S9 family peptidase [Acidobacteriota bacterium]